MLKWSIKNLLVHKNFNVSTKVVLSMIDSHFSSSQTLSSKRQNTFSEVRVDERDLELSFEGLNYSFSLFRHKISIEIIRLGF